MRRSLLRFGGCDRRTRNHFMVDGDVNPREWLNWHPREFKPWHNDSHRFEFEQQHWSHMKGMICRQVFLSDMKHMTKYPDPSMFILDVRMDTEKMHQWIPHSIWVPRDEIEYALQLKDQEFYEMYGVAKPATNYDVIVVSHNGLASEQAGWELKKAYYENVYNFRGGTNELFGEKYEDYPARPKLKPWKGPYPQSAMYTDNWSKRKVLTRTGPYDKEYEMQEFSLPDLELEQKRHPSEGPRSHMPWGLQ
eukprot:PhM_4_TR5865/c0_g1_i1/m.19487